MSATCVILNPNLQGQTLRAALAGNLTVECVPTARSEFIQLLGTHKPTEIVLDLTSTKYIDSSGLAVLVETRKKLGGAGKMALTGLTPEVARLLKVMRLDTMFRCEPAAGPAAS